MAVGVIAMIPASQFRLPVRPQFYPPNKMGQRYAANGMPKTTDTSDKRLNELCAAAIGGTVTFVCKKCTKMECIAGATRDLAIKDAMKRGWAVAVPLCNDCNV